MPQGESSRGTTKIHVPQDRRPSKREIFLKRDSGESWYKKRGYKNVRERAPYLKNRLLYLSNELFIEFLKGKKGTDSVKQLIFLYFNKTLFILM